MTTTTTTTFASYERAFLKRLRDSKSCETCYDSFASTYENDLAYNDEIYRNNLAKMSPTSGLWSLVVMSQEARFALQSVEQSVQSRVAIARLFGYTDENARALSAHPMIEIDNVLSTNDATRSDSRMYECVERAITHARTIDENRAMTRERIATNLLRIRVEIAELKERAKNLKHLQEEDDEDVDDSVKKSPVPAADSAKSSASRRLVELRRAVATAREEIKNLRESTDSTRKSIAKLSSDEYIASAANDAARILEQRYADTKAREYREFGRSLKSLTDESKTLSEKRSRLRRKHDELNRRETTSDELRNVARLCLRRVESIHDRVSENVKNLELYLSKEPHETVGMDEPSLYRTIKVLGLRYPYAVSRKDVDETCRAFVSTWIRQSMTLRALDSLERESRDTPEVVLKNVRAPLQFIAILYDGLRKHTYARLDVLLDLVNRRIFPNQVSSMIEKYFLAAETQPDEFRNVVGHRSGGVDSNLIYVCRKFWYLLKHADHKDLKYILETFIDDRRRLLSTTMEISAPKHR